MGNPQSLNRYSYINNDPINRIDPLGLDDVPATLPPEERQDLTYPGFADMMSGDCMLSGVSIQCSQLYRMMEAGATGIDTWIYEEDKQEARVRPGPQQPIDPQGVGIYRIWMPDDGRPRNSSYYDDKSDTLVINIKEPSGHWENVYIGSPQNPAPDRLLTPNERNLLRNKLSGLLTDNCKNFINNLIKTALRRRD